MGLNARYDCLVVVYYCWFAFVRFVGVYVWFAYCSWLLDNYGFVGLLLL